MDPACAADPGEALILTILCPSKALAALPGNPSLSTRPRMPEAVVLQAQLSSAAASQLLIPATVQGLMGKRSNRPTDVRIRSSVAKVSNNV